MEMWWLATFWEKDCAHPVQDDYRPMLAERKNKEDEACEDVKLYR